MLKFLFSLSSIVLFMTSAFTQTKEVDVTIFLKDGSTVEALMKPNQSYPWEDQKSISVYDKSLRGKDKIKKKQMTKYKAKDVLSYKYDDKYFISEKVSVEGRGDYSSTIGALPKFTFIERIINGSISVYRAYGYPPKMVSGTTYEKVYEDLRKNPEYYIVKGKDGDVNSMHSVNIEKWIKDSDVVSKKFANGEYGNLKRKKGKKFSNFLKGQIENENPNIIIKVIEDYNDDLSDK